MNKRILPLLLALALTLSGCASLLERSYSSVEPYTDRYWDSGAADTLRAESYQDLVNSLLMLIEQRSEKAVIRYYTEAQVNRYEQALLAKQEVENDTLLGSYLLKSIALTFVSNENYCTLTYTMSYREDAQDISTLMPLSDSQSLVDLLRLAVREGHDSLTAQFISRLSREEVLDAVDRLWQELYLDELEASGALTIPKTQPENEPPTEPEDEITGEEEGEMPGDEDAPPPENGEAPPPAENEPESEDPQENTGGGNSENPGENEDEPEPEPEPEPIIIFPPCPWKIIFYPDADIAEIVEIVLKTS